MATTVSDVHAQHGSYSISNIFTHNDTILGLSGSQEAAYSAAFDSDSIAKRHSACDECRKRKLKCSGESLGCTRCVKQGLVCQYSEQKQMGRPRKRQRTDDDTQHEVRPVASPPRANVSISDTQTSCREPAVTDPYIDPNLSAVDIERTDFQNVCNGPIAQAIRVQRQAALRDTPGLNSSNSDTSQSYNGPGTPDNIDIPTAQYPTDVAHWPDFSTLAILPVPVEDKWRGIEPGISQYFDDDADPNSLSSLPSVPACPCLPNLYLTMSTLSTLSAFPFTEQTIRTIECSTRTAKSVIYCNVCPQTVQTGSQNLMFCCTLLSVLADQWHRLCKMNVEELRKNFAKDKPLPNSFPSVKEGCEWRQFVQDLIRAYVMGEQSIPNPPSAIRQRAPTSTTQTIPSSEALTQSLPSSTPRIDPAGPKAQLPLLSLIDAITRRQRQWHRLDAPTDEFPDHIAPDLEAGHKVGGDDENGPGRHLCLEMINNTRCIVKSFTKDLIP